MRWQSLKISGRGGSFWLKRVFLLSLLLVALVAFNHSFAGGPDQEHPWDDLMRGSALDESTLNHPTNSNWLISIGIGHPIIIINTVTSVQRENLGKGKASESSEKNRVHLFIFIK